MAGINDINPLGPMWPTPATHPSPAIKDRKQPPKRQPPQRQQDDDNKDDDDPNHIDEYA